METATLLFITTGKNIFKMKKSRFIEPSGLWKRTTIMVCGW